MKGSENIKKVSIAHLMNCLIFQFNKKRTTRYDRQIVFMEIHKGFFVGLCLQKVLGKVLLP